MKRIFCWTIIFLMVTQPAWSANYFADDSGNGSDPASCVGCPCATAPATIQAVFTNNNLSPGDNVYVCGGTYNELVTWGTDDEGDVTAQVSLICYPGDTCTIDGQAVRAQCVSFTSRDYITIDGFTVTGATGSNLSSTSATTGHIIRNITCPGGADCLLDQAASNSEFRGFDCTGQTSECLNIQTAASNVTIGDITSSSGNRIYISNVTNLTIDDDMTISNGTIHNLYLNNISGYLNITGDITSSAAANYNFAIVLSSALINSTGKITAYSSVASDGVTILDSVLTSGSSFSWVETYGNKGSGIFLDDSSNVSFPYFLTYNNLGIAGVTITATGLGTHSGIVFGGEGLSKIYGNSGDGWAIFKDVTATIQESLIYENGGGGIPTDEGDGITGHETSTTYSYRNIIYNNDNTCFAHTGTANLYGYNNTCYSNGVAGGPRGGLWLTSTGVVDLQNNIVAENLPFEIYTSVAGLAGDTLNYNLYYHPADGNFADTNSDGIADYETLASFTAATGYDANSVYGNTLFINPSTTDFRIRANSPAIRTGTGTIKNGTPCSIGAYQFTIGGGGGASSGTLPLGHAQAECTIP